jgi:hypothetical protein
MYVLVSHKQKLSHTITHKIWWVYKELQTDALGLELEDSAIWRSGVLDLHSVEQVSNLFWATNLPDWIRC